MPLDAPFKISKLSAGQRAISAGNMNTAFRAIETAMNTQFDPKYFKVMRTPSGIMITMLSVDSTADDESKWIFGLEYTATGCTVYNPALQLGGTWYSNDSTDITFSGDPSYIYAQWLRTSPYTLTVEQSATFPASNATHLKWVLAKFELSGSSYILTSRYHRGAIQLDLPLV